VVQSGISNLLGGQPDFPIIFEALGGALAGNAIFFALAGGPPTDVSLVVAIPYICSDYRKLTNVVDVVSIDTIYQGIKDNTFSGFQNSIKAASKVRLPVWTCFSFTELTATSSSLISTRSAKPQPLKSDSFAPHGHMTQHQLRLYQSMRQCSWSPQTLMSG
jgi:hypothetical protein